MENKYYTPKADEFHVGFEFEVLQFLGEPIFDKVSGSVDLSTVEHTWLPRKVKFLSDVSENFCVVYSGGEKTQESIGNSIRVKYLDKEDIESLGFTFIGKSIDLWFDRLGGSHTPGGRATLTNYKLHYNLMDHELHIEGFFGNYSEGKLFEGIIKNKSELRKLMYQLNILKDEK